MTGMENYFFDIDHENGQDKSLVLIVYDIIDNKKRTKLAKLLQGYGVRVQKSAFEAWLTKTQYNKLISDVPPFCGGEDSIRIYKIIGKGQVKSWGYSVQSLNDDVIVM